MNIMEIEKHILPKKQNNFNELSNFADLVISFKPATKKSVERVSIYFYHAVFKEYKYITFFKVSNQRLCFKLSSNNNGTAYALTKNGKNSVRTQVGGENAKALMCFKGAYFIRQIQGGTEPYFYIARAENRGAEI